MFKYTIILIAALFSAGVTYADNTDKNRIFYKKYLADGRFVRILKNSSSVKVQPHKKYIEWPEAWPGKKIPLAPTVYQVDNYKMIITGGSSENIAVWEKEVRTQKTEQPDLGASDFTVYDIQSAGIFI